MTRAITPSTLGQTAARSRSVPGLLSISSDVGCGLPAGSAVRVNVVVKIAPYGTWSSPISADVAASAHRDRRWVGRHAGEVRVLTASHPFMSAPKCSPDGRRAAWIGWEHPRMPWDGTELCVADILDDGTFGPHRVIAGGPAESVCQVEWDGPDSVLALTDPDGWWNLYRIGLDGTRTNLAPCAEELGGPMWMLGSRWFGPPGGGRHAILR